MTTLIVAIVIVALFVALAVKNWGRAIGAGPTILIVGALVLFGFGFSSYASGQSDQRTADADRRSRVDAYNSCIVRVERSIGNREQWETLIELLAAELPERPDLGTTLTTALDINLPRLSVADCPPNPGSE